MAKIAALAMAVLGGAVILAKKAFIVAAVSLITSSMTASKKKAASNANTGDYVHRRLGTSSYTDLDTGIQKQYQKHIEPLSHSDLWPNYRDYHQRHYPNFIHNHGRFYPEDIIENSSVESQLQVYSRDRSKDNTYDDESDWYGLTHPEDV
jgi:hypothetical protein